MYLDKQWPQLKTIVETCFTAFKLNSCTLTFTQRTLIQYLHTTVLI